jgi:hypothetical protein
MNESSLASLTWDLRQKVNRTLLLSATVALAAPALNPLLAAAFLDFRFRTSRPVTRAKLIQMG